MMLKQVSWRRSNQALFLLSLLLVPTYLFSADPGGATKAAEQAADAAAKAEAAARSKAGAGAGMDDDIDSSSSDTSDDSSTDATSAESEVDSKPFGSVDPRGSGTSRTDDDILEDVVLRQSANIFGLVSNVLREKIASKHGSTSKRKGRGQKKEKTDHVDQYTDKEIRLQQSILAAAPPRVRLLHNTLKKVGKRFRGALFYGAPGGGKTRGAQAIFRQCGFKVHMVTPSDCRAIKRGGTADKLIQILNGLLKKKNVGILIDEIHVLAGHPEQESNDTRETSTALHQWLDNQLDSTRTDVGIICTGNDIACLDKPLLSRFSGRTFKFKGPETATEKAAAFAEHFPFNEYDSAARSEWDGKVKALFEKYPLLSGRDFETLSSSSEEFRDVRIHELCQCTAACSCSKKINYDDIENAMQHMMQEREDSKYYKDRETQQEQAERHFEVNKERGDIGLKMQGVGLAVQAAPAAASAAQGMASAVHGIVMGGM